MKHGHKLGLLVLAAHALAACGSDEIDLDYEPQGPVARNAQEAWPERPEIAPLTLETMARACSAWAACEIEDPAVASQVDGPLAVDFCLTGLEWSAERAIPIESGWISPFGDANERVEFFVECALAAPDCGTLNGCLTPREIDMACEEDGCRAFTDYQVSCQGDIAILAGPSGESVQRDCSRALSHCDENSPTGCTDRHYSACPEPPPQPDRCDGNVRLGCDGLQQVSYRDCTRMGGACVTKDGTSDCHYGDASCENGSHCEGQTLHVCLRGAAAAILAPALCE